MQRLPPIPEEQISQELFESRLEPIEHLSQPFSTPQGSQIFDEAFPNSLSASPLILSGICASPVRRPKYLEIERTEVESYLRDSYESSMTVQPTPALDNFHSEAEALEMAMKDYDEMLKLLPQDVVAQLEHKDDEPAQNFVELRSALEAQYPLRKQHVYRPMKWAFWLGLFVLIVLLVLGGERLAIQSGLMPAPGGGESAKDANIEHPLVLAQDTCPALNLHSFPSRNEAQIPAPLILIRKDDNASSKNGLKFHARLQHLPDGTVLIEPIEALSHEEAQDLVK